MTHLKEIDERLQELKMQEEDWKKKCEEMEENANRAKSIVRLNVGGQRFETSKMTLMGNPFFKAMLESGIWQVKMIRIIPHSSFTRAISFVL